MSDTTMIETLTVEETVELLRDLGMRISAPTLRLGIQQGVFPWGTYIQGERGPVYHIYRVMLEDWIAERSREGVA